MMEKYTLRDPKKRNYHRDGTLPKAEVMVTSSSSILSFISSGQKVPTDAIFEFFVSKATKKHGDGLLRSQKAVNLIMAHRRKAGL